jgi:pyruvate formate lyase activating enzyme
LLKEARKADIHTCLDTTGYTNSEIWQAVIENVDLLLYDVKMLDKNRHEILTGVSNDTILNNLKLCINEKIDIIIRIPIIPGYNFVKFEKELFESVQWLANIGIKKFELIPYHKFGEQKYKMLGKSYDLKVEPLDQNCILNIVRELSKNLNIVVQVSIPLIT